MRSARRIAVDARPIDESINPSISGISQYTKHLLKHFYEITDYEWHLLTSGEGAISHLSGATHVTSAGYTNSILGTLHAQFAFSKVSRQQGADLFWSPRHHLPFSVSCPAIVSIHDLAWKNAADSMPRIRRLLDKHLMSLSIDRSNLILVPSHFTKSEVTAWKPSAESKIRVVPLASRFEPAEAEPKSEGPLLILCVATNEPRKNLPRMLKAFKASLQYISEPRPKLVVAGGEGWKSEPLSKVIQRLELEQCVTHEKNVSEQRLADLYQSCAFLAFPSLYEGFGLPIVEAFSFGKPAITGDNSALPEVAGDAALLVNAKSEEEISRAIVKLCNDSDLRTRLTDRAIEMSKSYSWRFTADKTARIFEELLSESPEDSSSGAL